MINELLLTVASASWLFELARVLVGLDHVARFVVNANHGVMSMPPRAFVAESVRFIAWFDAVFGHFYLDIAL
jgi:hypothetical protein